MQVAVVFVPVANRDSPNARVSNAETPMDVYYRCMTVAFASVRRWNPLQPLRLITTEHPPARHERVLERLGVEIDLRPFEHCPPEGYCANFATSMYMLDALSVAVNQDTLFLDPDVLCVRSLDRLSSLAGRSTGALLLRFSPGESINGLSPSEAAELHALLGESRTEPMHYGGEAYWIPSSLQSEICQRAEKAWQLSLARFAMGQTRFTTEEHVMSFALRGLSPVDLSPEVRRIWTAARYRTVVGDESTLTIWHLPSEKGRGFDHVYACLEDADSWFWTSPSSAWVQRSSRLMGLSRRPPQRFVRDVAGNLLHRVGLR